MALNALGLGIVFTASNLASGVIQKLSKDFSGLDKNIDVGGKKISTTFIEIGAGLALIKAGSIGLSALGGATDFFADFESALTKTAVTGQLTAKEVAALQETVLRLGPAFGRDLIEVAEGAFPIISAGFTDVTDLALIFESSLKLASAGFAGLEESTRAVIGFVAGFGENAEEAAKQTDLLVVAAGRAQADVGEFAAALPSAIALSKEFGVTQEELAAALAAMTLTTQTARVSITQLRGVLTAIARSDSPAAQLAAKGIGLEFSVAALKAKGFAKFLDEVRVKAEGDIKVLRKLFPDVEGLNAILTLTGSQAEAFADILDDVRNSLGAADKGFAQIVKTLNFMRDQVSALSQVIKLKFGEVAIPMFKGLTRIVRTMGQVFVALPPGVFKLVGAFVAFASVLATVGGSFLIIRAAFRFWPIMAKFLGLSAKTMGAALLPFLVLMLKIAAVTLLLKVVIEKRFGPLSKVFEKAGNALVILFTLFRQGGNLSGKLADDFLALADPIQGIIVTIFTLGSKAIAFFSGLGNALAPILDLINPLLDSVFGLVGAIGELAFEILRLILPPGMVEDFKEFFTTGTGGFKKLGETIGLVASFIINGIVRGIQIAIAQVQTLAKIASSILKFSRGDFKGGLQALKDIGKIQVSGFTGGINAPRPAPTQDSAGSSLLGNLGGPGAAGALGTGNIFGNLLDPESFTTPIVEAIEEGNRNKNVDLRVDIDGQRLAGALRKAGNRNGLFRNVSGGGRSRGAGASGSF